MLTELFLAASSAPPNLSSSSAQSAQLKDAGIYLHTYQPQPALRNTFKKSRTQSNCVVANSTHVFAAQDGKSTIHVYNQEKGGHEATLAFPAKIHSLALAASGSILIMGLNDGSLMLWELLTGRQTQTPQSHLQPVTSLAVDPTSNFVISGSADPTVLVWALTDLLSLASSPLDAHTQIEPRHTLTSHRGGITAVATGQGHMARNLLATGSKDKTIILWDLHSGLQLQTYLVPMAPVCLAFDPADRALYTAYEDGRVQVLDLLSDPTAAKPAASSVHTPTSSITPIQPSTFTLLPLASATPDPALCLALSYDGTTILTGHASGLIRAWSVADRRFTGTVADYPSAPITSLTFLPIKGFSGERPDEVTTVVKPKPHDTFSGRNGTLTGSYSLHTQLGHCRLLPRINGRPSQPRTEFDEALEAEGLPAELLTSSLSFSLELPSRHANDGSVHAEATDPTSTSDKQDEIEKLKAQNKHLMNLLVAAQEDKNKWFNTVQEYEQQRTTEVSQGPESSKSVNGKKKKGKASE